MADVYTRIGYIKGATGATGAQGTKGDTGDAATIQVGSVTTVPYGQTANVVNSGTEQAAIFDFTIPQGRPGQQTTEMDNLLLNSITTSSASFPIPAVGETGKVIFGKITKWFSDMAALVATKLNAANVVNNLTTTSSGYALDARQGKTLNDKLTAWVTPNTVSSRNDNVSNSGTMQSLLGRAISASGLYLIQGYMNYNSARPVEMWIKRIYTDGTERVLDTVTFTDQLSSSAYLSCVDYATRPAVAGYQLWGRWSGNVTGCVAILTITNLFE